MRSNWECRVLMRGISNMEEYKFYLGKIEALGEVLEMGHKLLKEFYDGSSKKEVIHESKYY